MSHLNLFSFLYSALSHTTCMQHECMKKTVHTTLKKRSYHTTTDCCSSPSDSFQFCSPVKGQTVYTLAESGLLKLVVFGIIQKRQRPVNRPASDIQSQPHSLHKLCHTGVKKERVKKYLLLSGKLKWFRSSNKL